MVKTANLSTPVKIDNKYTKLDLCSLTRKEKELLLCAILFPLKPKGK